MVQKTDLQNIEIDYLSNSIIDIYRFGFGAQFIFGFPTMTKLKEVTPSKSYKVKQVNLSLILIGITSLSAQPHSYAPDPAEEAGCARGIVWMYITLYRCSTSLLHLSTLSLHSTFLYSTPSYAPSPCLSVASSLSSLPASHAAAFSEAHCHPFWCANKLLFMFAERSGRPSALPRDGQSAGLSLDITRTTSSKASSNTDWCPSISSMPASDVVMRFFNAKATAELSTTNRTRRCPDACAQDKAAHAVDNSLRKMCRSSVTSNRKAKAKASWVATHTPLSLFSVFSRRYRIPPVTTGRRVRCQHAVGMPLTAIYAAGVSTPLMGARGLHPSPKRAQIAAHAFFIQTVETCGPAHFTGSRDRPSAQGQNRPTRARRRKESCLSARLLAGGCVHLSERHRAP
jgi:hypothetical protein